MTDENNERGEERIVESNSKGRKWIVIAAGLLIAFLLGLVPMWLSKRSVGQDLSVANRELRRQRIQNSLSAAEIYARRGEYETARQNASSFFTEIQAEANNAESQIKTAQERTQIPALLAARDEIITLLSRADPAAGERLSNLYVDYRAATGAVQ